MKKYLPILAILFLAGTQTVEAQIFKKLKKRAEKAAERTVERRVEKETSKKTDQVLDSILEPGKKKKKDTPGSNGENSKDSRIDPNNPNNSQEAPDPEEIKIYSKFDFVPGDKILFFDDFSRDYVGDFPSKWNTNGTGEIVTLGANDEKWFEMKAGHGVHYMPLIEELPDEFTLEFDLLATGVDRQTASTTVMKIILSDGNSFKLGNYAYAQMSFCQYAAVGLWVRNDKEGIMNEIGTDIREAVLNQPHISIAVNKQRFRMWVDEKKVIDIPRLISAEFPPKTIKFELNNFKDGKERLFIKNLKVAEGGLDLRRTLIAEGKVSTNGILFDSGSATILPRSMGIIRQISQVLQQEQSMKLNIIGHTDADGDAAVNMALSKRRADAVKKTLVNIYNINASRLTTEGKGESEPVGDNATDDGKALNRRVEFIKV